MSEAGHEFGFGFGLMPGRMQKERKYQVHNHKPHHDSIAGKKVKRF